VQRVPELFLTIKKDVDEHRQPGRYALTGSANPLLIPRLGDSLVGRMEIFTLFPLSQGELQNTQDAFIDILFDHKLPSATPLTKEQLYQKIETGGYPQVQGINYGAREDWFNAYVTMLLQRDVKDLANISGLTELPNLLSLLATRAGNLLNVAELSRTSGLSTSTLHRYLTLLETVFLIEFLQPWSSNLGKRLVKAPKAYMVDTGLLSFLLGFQVNEQVFDARIGAILENFVIGELFKQATWSQVRIKIFHARTASGIEVDCILEDRQGRLVGIEIKNSQTVTPQDFKGLKHFAELAGDKFLQGIVLYTGSHHVPFGQNLHALPISTLWAPHL